MLNKPPTIKDIARQLNISVSTVSRAIRNASDVSAETKKTVMALVEELNYQPNQLALNLRSKQTHTIGVIVPNLDYVLSMMVRGIDEVALEAGYTVIICQSNESYGREILNARRLLDRGVDGFIVSVSSETNSFDHFKKIQEKNIPMVVFDRVASQLKAPSVRIDNTGGGFMATEHLIEQGYKRIAVLAGPQNLEISNSRLDGYKNALKKHKIKIDPSLIIHCDFNQDYAFFATEELLSLKKRPDAIFTISDRMALGAMLAIKKKGLQMPNDIGLIGFNDEPVLNLLTPSISSIEQPSFEVGKLAAKLFIETMHNMDNIDLSERIIKTKLIARESSLKINAKKLK
ncbi:MAG: LacI family DNA-binding transcriptional regulator [Bacteroidetes bacterium]|nr:LacI family DNA-binding transcriptional regulator [Bacteroidota bacterium]MBS1755651.1 LacI family DNA-binding transcriptional regulator [Bacteroidota bacterium]